MVALALEVGICGVDERVGLGNEVVESVGELEDVGVPKVRIVMEGVNVRVKVGFEVKETVASLEGLEVEEEHGGGGGEGEERGERLGDVEAVKEGVEGEGGGVPLFTALMLGLSDLTADAVEEGDAFVDADPPSHCKTPPPPRAVLVGPPKPPLTPKGEGLAVVEAAKSCDGEEAIEVVCVAEEKGREGVKKMLLVAKGTVGEAASQGDGVNAKDGVDDREVVG